MDTFNNWFKQIDVDFTANTGLCTNNSKCIRLIEKQWVFFTPPPAPQTQVSMRKLEKEIESTVWVFPEDEGKIETLVEILLLDQTEDPEILKDPRILEDPRLLMDPEILEDPGILANPRILEDPDLAVPRWGLHALYTSGDPSLINH